MWPHDFVPFLSVVLYQKWAGNARKMAGFCVLSVGAQQCESVEERRALARETASDFESFCKSEPPRPLKTRKTTADKNVCPHQIQNG